MIYHNVYIITNVSTLYKSRVLSTLFDTIDKYKVNIVAFRNDMSR